MSRRSPAPAVLIQEQDRLSRRPRARSQARCLDLHQRKKPLGLWLLWRQRSQGASQTERLLAEVRPHPVVPCSGRVPLVEDEVDDLQDRRQAALELAAAWHLEWDARRGKRALCPDDALGYGRLRSQIGTRDLIGLEPTHKAQRERCTGFFGEDRVAGDEHEPEDIVADVLPALGLRLPRCHALRGLVAQIPLSSLNELAPP